MTVPGYWMNETSGVLRPAIEAYLNGTEMTPEQILAMRAYLRQWIVAGDWAGGPVLGRLRKTVETITSERDVDRWLRLADLVGIDPL